MALDPMIDAALRADPRPEVRAAARFGDLERRIEARERGAGIDTSWHAPDFEADWSAWDVATGTWPPGYSKLANGLVMLRGLVRKSTAPVSGDVVLWLPPTFRIGESDVFPAVCIDLPSGLTVRPDGAVVIRAVPAGAGVGSWWGLAGVRFRAEA
jgi:hypothetical protein